MHRDFAKKRRLSPKLKRRGAKHAAHAHAPNTAWIGMATGLVLGLVLSALLYWKIHSHQTSPIDSPIAINEKSPTAKMRLTTKNTAQRFDFYTVLPENEAKADPYYNPALAEPKPIAQQTQPLTSANAERSVTEIKPFKPAESKSFTPLPSPDPYILQVGSFKHFEQADKLRAQLTQSGKKASIQTFKMSSQETWYRVYIGPFRSRDEALQQQAQLEQSHPIHSLIVKYCV